MSLPSVSEFKPKFLAPTGKQGSMVDVVANMESRGLHLIKRKQTDDNINMEKTYDAGTEQKNGTRFVNSCRDIGLAAYECRPFYQKTEDSMEENRKCSFFYVPLRFNSYQPNSKIIFVDMSSRQLIYIGQKQKLLGEPIQLAGCKIDGDLVAKRKFHLWPKGTAHKSSLNHTLWGEDYRDQVVEFMKIRDVPDFPFVCIHEGPLSKKGKSGLTYTKRFGRVLNGMLILFGENDNYPKEGVSLFGPSIEKLSKNQIRITTDERKFQLKFASEHIRDLWIRAFEVAKQRSKKEQDLIQIYNKTVRKEIKKERRRRASLHGNSTTVEESFTSYREDDSKMNQSQDSPKNVNNNGSPKKHNSPKQQHSPKTFGNKNNKKVTNDDVEEEEIEEEDVDEEEEDNIEIEVRLYDSGTGKTVSVGLMEMESEASVYELRNAIREELDHIPDRFIFLRSAAVVSRKLERRHNIKWVIEDGIVTIKKLIVVSR